MSWQYQPRVHALLPGEMRLKVWLIDEAEREHSTTSAIAKRLTRGKYPSVKSRHINKRVVFVTDLRAGK